MPIQNYDRPIFILGQSNSGTKVLFFTLLEHSQVGGFRKEIHNYGVCPQIPDVPCRLYALYPIFEKYRNNLVGYPESEVKQKLKDHSAQSFEFQNGERLLFKDPRLSIKIPMIRRLWPDAYIIHIIRNPYCVVEGIRRRNRVDIPTAAAQWVVNHNIIELDSEGMERFKIVRYEDMVQANEYPGNNPFWEDLLKFLELRTDGLQIPNQCTFSKFVQTANEGSIKNLNSWEKKIITKIVFPSAVKYGYQPLELDD